MDFDAGLQRGIGFLTVACEAGCTGQFVIVTERVEAASAAMALKLGAGGIFLKSEAPDRLALADTQLGLGQALRSHDRTV